MKRAQALLVVTSILTAPGTFAAQPVASNVASTAFAPVSAAAVCANGLVSPRYEHPSEACWTAFDVALARGSVIDAVAAVRTGCAAYGRADHCLLVSWIDSRPRKTQGAQHGTPPGLTAMRLARLADDISAWEMEDAYDGLVAREKARAVRP